MNTRELYEEAYGLIRADKSYYHAADAWNYRGVISDAHMTVIRAAWDAIPKPTPVREKYDWWWWDDMHERFFAKASPALQARMAIERTKPIPYKA
jgi:hypothetical protein